jgi:hypothetical protein
MENACGLSCELCPAAARCGGSSNFCLVGRCKGCESNQLSRMEVRASVIRLLGGLELLWPRPVRHHQPQSLPDHLPVLVQAYADPIEVPWVALHAGRVLGVTGRGLTPKHRRPIHEVYRLAPGTLLALEFYVEDRVLEGLWANRRCVIRELRQLGLNLVLSPNFSVWRDHSRFEQLVQQRRSFAFYHELIEAGLPAIPDVGWSRFEPDGRLWSEWINAQPDLRAVSIFCGGRKIHAERRAQRETEEDIALFHRAVRSNVAFVLGGVHAPERLLALRSAAPGRQLVICNGMAYALAQRRRLLDRSQERSTARSARECFLSNSAFSDRTYAQLLGKEMADAV